MTAYMIASDVGERGVIDTNVFVSALISHDGAANAVLRLCFNGYIKPIMGTTLYMEYCDVIQRDDLFVHAALDKVDRMHLLDDFMSLCEWTSIYYLWRPNLPDEADNHLLELAMAGGGTHIVTKNKRDFIGGDLLFPGIKLMTPAECIAHYQHKRH